MKNTSSIPTHDAENLVALLSRLSAACEKDSRRFERAAREVSNEELAMLFSRYARRRAEFAAELGAHADRLLGKPADESAVVRVHRRISLKPGVSRRDDGTLLSDCEHAERALLQMYDEALENDLPSELQMSLRRHSLAVSDVYQQMRDLCAALAWCAVPMAV